MCGRAAQTQGAVQAAALSLGLPSASNTPTGTDATRATATQAAATSEQPGGAPANPSNAEWSQDNYNMSPGMDAVVFWKDQATGEIRADCKVWGLVTRHGSKEHPLEAGMGPHFSNKMFNARSDTLYSTPTFRNLANQGKSCLVALNGFFEWKQTPGQKQPYFIHRKSDAAAEGQRRRPYLLVAGLYTSVPTCRPDDPVLDTFTMLTTEACEPLKWLHHRMPVCVWDENLARQWLQSPIKHIHDQLDDAARKTAPDQLAWHAVTPAMSKTEFRSSECLKPLPHMKTIESFFGVVKKKKKKPKPSNDTTCTSLGQESSSSIKRPAASSGLSQSSAAPSKKIKRPTPKKKGPLDAFFSK